MEHQGDWQSGFREVTRILAMLGLVMGATAGILRGLDAFGGYLQGERRGVKEYRSIESVERKVGARVLLPAYFPDTLEWPPATVRLSGEPSPAVALSFVGRQGKGHQLFIAQTLGGPSSIPPELLPPGQRLHATVIAVNGSEARLSRVVGEDGEIWHELSWRTEGRQLALRFKGPVDELLRIARSMGRGRP